MKTFYKKLSDGKLLGVEVGGVTTDCGGSEHVYFAFDVKDKNVQIHNMYSEEAPLRFAFLCSGEHELKNFIEALEFALGVLKQGKKKELDWAF